MRHPEQRFWDRMRRALAGAVHMERIENLVGVGTPDVWVLAPTGRVTPVELKAVVGLPARPTTRVLGRAGLSVDQRNWHLAWTQAGGTSGILVGVGGNRQFLLPGRWHDEINAFTAAELQRHAAATEWPGVVEILNGGFPDEN